MIKHITAAILVGAAALFLASRTSFAHATVDQRLTQIGITSAAVIVGVWSLAASRRARRADRSARQQPTYYR